MHTAMVGYQGEKMSKSLGNLVMVSDLLQTYSPNVLRLYLASHHYREAWSYAENDLQEFHEIADRLCQAVGVENGKRASFSPAEYVSQFNESMEDDLRTPGAVHALEGLAQGILEAGKGRHDVKEAQGMLRKYGRVLGLSFGSDAPEARVLKGWHAKKWEAREMPKPY